MPLLENEILVLFFSIKMKVLKSSNFNQNTTTHSTCMVLCDAAASTVPGHVQDIEIAKRDYQKWDICSAV